MYQLSDLFNVDKQKPKLLVVDDQPLIIRVLYELFKDECEIFMATNGTDAIAKCKQVKPDLVLLDLVMPDMDGYQVCKHLKADEDLSDIPIIFVTASFEQEDEIKGFENGAVDFIQKPINPIITLARVRTHVRLKQQSDLLKSMALNDGLTGIANRRHFESSLHIDWLQCAREKSPMSLLLMDIDEFKKFNDHYGHVAGDGCLQKVAKAIASVLGRPYDLAARYGGEEFAIVLPKTNHEGAQYIAYQVHNAINSLAIPHIKSQIGIVTLSIGVSTTIPNHKGSPDSLVQQSDKALYQAKENGRNQSVFVEFVS
jgi:diguanylate cyclase (GGDEF)-like protein